jgi:hypothetical protein
MKWKVLNLSFSLFNSKKRKKQFHEIIKKLDVLKPYTTSGSSLTVIKDRRMLILYTTENYDIISLVKNLQTE